MAPFLVAFFFFQDEEITTILGAIP
jgi:hypothetical protein